MRNVVVLGSTGSIGRSTLDVIAASDGRLVAWGLAAHSSFQQLEEQAQQFSPKRLVATHPDSSSHPWTLVGPSTSISFGSDELISLAREPEVHTVVAAIVGSAGLQSAWNALDCGKTVALANKETLVMGGSLVTDLAKEKGGKILPVDSEHSAVFQALAAGRRQDVKRIILTASGGPFRDFSKQQMAVVTVEQALNHPTWQMGPKITIDSATMMNKALEIIEARWLFDLRADQIDVVIHPQSLIHSMVEFDDGSVMAQLSPPDMRLPIQYALTFPERWKSPAKQLDLNNPLSFHFEPPDYDRFPALGLGLEVAAAGGTTGCVLNAANEAAVAEFLEGRIGFSDIVPACRSVLDQHTYDAKPTLEQLFELDAWARQEITRWIQL